MRICLFFVLCIVPAELWAQSTYVFPIRPKQRNHLSAGHGELRGTHFHTALDIRTQRRTGLSVYATAAGYVSRIKVESLGYGRVLYVQHANGYTSVYAHLEAFTNDLERWTIEQQYIQNSFEVDLRPPPWKFPVQAAGVIAFSGNTGSSTGPHLHFEIRDEEQHALDPLRLGEFQEVVDIYPPQLQRLALRTMDINARINGQFGRFEFILQGARGKYRLQQQLQLRGCIGVELMARDMYEKNNSGYGLPELRVQLDNEVQFEQYIHALDFAEQRHIAVHMNYAAHVLQERRYSKLYVDEGNILSFYTTNARRGVLCFEEVVSPRRLLLQGWDASGNEAQLQFVVNAKQLKQSLSPPFDVQARQGYFVQDNTLLIHLRVAGEFEPLVLSFVDNSMLQLSAAYVHGSHGVYLWDLRKGVPRKAYRQLGHKELPLDFDLQALVPSRQAYYFSNRHVRLSFLPTSLYDTLYLRFEKVASKEHTLETFYFKNEGHPLRGDLDFTLLPEERYIWEKTSAYRMDRDKLVFHETAWQSGEACFKSDAFGPFVLLTDTLAPRLLRVEKYGHTFRFYVSDDISGLDSWSATVDDKWLLMEHAPKQGFLQPRPLPGQSLPKGTLSLVLRDKQNNAQTYIYHLKP